MPDHPIIAVPKLLVADLNEHDFGMEFEARRSNDDFNYELDGPPQLFVDVVHHPNWEAKLFTRARLEHVFKVDIIPRKKLSQSHNEPSTGRIAIEEIDRLVQLSADIVDRYQTVRFDGYKDAVWQATEPLAIPIHKHIKMRQFTAVIRLTFKGWTDRHVWSESNNDD